MKIKLEPVIDFGKMPIANGFLTPEQFGKEYLFDMVLGYDPGTHAIGLINKVPPEKMFHENYAFFSSTSRGMQNHFRETAKKLLPYAGRGIVVEMGSNDGIMLKAWKDLGVRAIGVEPSKNVAEVSRQKGHTVISKFMSDKVADEILDQGKVSLVFGANVSCHIEFLEDYLKAVTRLIGKKGVFVFEDPYFIDIVEKTSYDQIYDEHVWYFTISFINKMLESFGFHVFECEHVPVHGGELRMYVGHKDTYKVKPAVSVWLKKEENLENQLQILKKNTEKSKKNLVALLQKIKSKGKKICGFAATSKATTVFNYCDIGPDLIPFVTDTTPEKQSKYYPGVYIPIISQSVFEEGKTDKSKLIDYAFLGAWNHYNEIEKYQSWYRAAGGHWITHVPSPRII